MKYKGNRASKKSNVSFPFIQGPLCQSLTAPPLQPLPQKRRDIKNGDSIPLFVIVLPKKSISFSLHNKFSEAKIKNRFHVFPRLIFPSSAAIFISCCSYSTLLHSLIPLTLPPSPTPSLSPSLPLSLSLSLSLSLFIYLFLSVLFSTLILTNFFSLFISLSSLN